MHTDNTDTTSRTVHFPEDCLLMDERIAISTQLRQTVLESIHLTHSGSAAMLDLGQHVWFPHIHRSLLQMAQSCRQCTEQSKNLKAATGKQHSFQMGSVVEPNEKFPLDFAWPFPNGPNKVAYIYVAIDKWSKIPMANFVSNTTVDITKKKLCNDIFQIMGCLNNKH